MLFYIYVNRTIETKVNNYGIYFVCIVRQFDCYVLCKCKLDVLVKFVKVCNYVLCHVRPNAVHF